MAGDTFPVLTDKDRPEFDRRVTEQMRWVVVEAELTRLRRCFEALVAAHSELQKAFLDRIADGTVR